MSIVIPVCTVIFLSSNDMMYYLETFFDYVALIAEVLFLLLVRIFCYDSTSDWRKCPRCGLINTLHCTERKEKNKRVEFDITRSKATAVAKSDVVYNYKCSVCSGGTVNMYFDMKDESWQ